VTLTFKQHHRSQYRKDALVHEDHFPVKCLRISQLERNIFAFLVGGDAICSKLCTAMEQALLEVLTQNFDGECHQWV
jgi:hypothetical protein